MRKDKTSKKPSSSALELNEQQSKLFNILESSSNNIFVTGKAGTGKSVLLQYFKKFSNKSIAVVAPTGVAAVNVKGQTIHSLFKIAPTLFDNKPIRIDRDTKMLLSSLDTIVIDEISMVRADLMDAIDATMRKATGINLPFGGKQIVMFGDLYQLSPIVPYDLQDYFNDNYGGFYFFNAHAWKNAPMEKYELQNIFRQKDEAFKNTLNNIRIGNVTPEVLDTLNSRFTTLPENAKAIVLTTTNKIADQTNKNHLEKITSKPVTYTATKSGRFDENLYPTNEKLVLKVGAQVMFLRNDSKKRWFNGTIGIVRKLKKHEVVVEVDGTVHNVEKEKWEKLSYKYSDLGTGVDENIEGTFSQYPLKLAWGITIHKSQGQTFKEAIIDLGYGAFTYGQTYVALSRCISLEGIYLSKQIMAKDVKVDPRILSFMETSVQLDY